MPRRHGRETDLFVELVEVVIDPVLSVDEDGVLLDLLCCGHLGTVKMRNGEEERERRCTFGKDTVSVVGGR